MWNSVSVQDFTSSDADEISRFQNEWMNKWMHK